MIYVQYILAFVAVIQMFLIMALFGRCEKHKQSIIRSAKAGVQLSMAMMSMQVRLTDLQNKVLESDNQQQSPTDHQK